MWKWLAFLFANVWVLKLHCIQFANHFIGNSQLFSHLIILHGYCVLLFIQNMNYKCLFIKVLNLCFEICIWNISNRSLIDLLNFALIYDNIFCFVLFQLLIVLSYIHFSLLLSIPIPFPSYLSHGPLIPMYSGDIVFYYFPWLDPCICFSLGPPYF